MKSQKHTNCSRSGDNPVLRFVAGLAVIFLVFSADLHGAEAGGSWTNLAGRVLKGTPKYLQGQTVAFVRDGSEKVVEYPMSIFPAEEQERLRSHLRDTSIPEGLQAAWAFSTQHLKRSQLLYQSGQISEADYQKTVDMAIAAFRIQAAPLIKQQKISEERLDRILLNIRDAAKQNNVTR